MDQGTLIAAAAQWRAHAAASQLPAERALAEATARSLDF